jgi:hypothetical protein
MIWTLHRLRIRPAVMWKFVYGPITTALEDRDKKVEDAISAAEVARKEAEAQMAQAKAELEKAQADASAWSKRRWPAPSARPPKPCALGRRTRQGRAAEGARHHRRREAPGPAGDPSGGRRPDHVGDRSSAAAGRSTRRKNKRLVSRLPRRSGWPMTLLAKRYATALHRRPIDAGVVATVEC